MVALSEPLEPVRKEAVDALVTRLNAMCDGADDALFDLSQKAPADEQQLYYDAMRELRLKRQSVVEAFRAAMDGRFEALAPLPVAAATPKKAALNVDSLSLLGEDELDVSVAFQSMVGRARDIVATDLDHLRQRVGKVLLRELEPEQVPLHPQVVCEHFRAATEPLALPLKARLILYKLFERNLLDVLQDIIAAANQALVRAGVLPEIKSTKPRPLPSGAVGRDRSRGGDKKESAGDKRGGGGGEAASVPLPAAVAELIALTRAAMGSQAVAGATPIPLQDLAPDQIPVMQDGKLTLNGVPVQSATPLQVVAPAELTALLTRLQQLQPDPDAGDDADGTVKQGLSRLMKEGTESPRALNGADDDVINLVAMLFDCILDDRDLPTEIKALLGRLQIPFLKVALIDRALFAKEDHPARMLLNCLAKAGVGWTRDADDGLFAKIEEVVHAIINGFSDDLALFTHLWRDVSEFIAEREKRMQVVEARLRDREEGQAKADIARRAVRDVVAARLANRTLPPEALAIVQGAWQRVLYMTALREGTEGELWQQRVKVLEVLVWCVQKYEKEEFRVRQRGLLPRLVVSLRKGFEATGFDLPRGEEMLAALTRVVTALAGGEQARTVRVVTEVVAAAPKPVDGKPVVPASAAAEAVQVLRSSEEEVVIAASPPPPPPPPPPEPTDERWMQMADNLPPGTWLEFSEEGFKVRLKLAARIRVHNRLVFVNSRGVKIAEKSPQQLAADLQSGVARLVEDTALFDRALETMIGRLKNAQAAV